MKRWISVFLFLCTAYFCPAQTLFTYGNKKVSSQDFVRAFEKNQTETVSYQSAITEYLELYIRFKLKVQAAYDARMDTLPNQHSDLQGFRRQIEEPFLTDTMVFRKLVDEAFIRSQKEISLSHIFIPFRSDYAANPNSIASISKSDSLAALQKMKEVTDRLKTGESFEDLARKYSGDPSSAGKGGKMGTITVFTLPYVMENAVYGLGNQQVSGPVTSVRGYHFFKKTGEQPARGKIKAAQIMLAIDPEATAEQKGAIKRQADSIYTAIQAGSDFGELAGKFSNDKNTLGTGGMMPEFGIGQFDASFEEKVFAMQKAGQVSPPFETAYGFHIVKILEKIPVEKSKKAAEPFLQSAVRQDARNAVAKQSFEKQMISKLGYKKAPYDANALWRMTDSFIFLNKKIVLGALNENSTLFTVGKKNAKVKEWMEFEKNKYAAGVRTSYPVQMQDFVMTISRDYYREHLEEYNPLFREQLQEFADGNLLFEVMEKKVWNKAAVDSVGLKNYYQQHKNKYVWAPSVNAIIFNASDKKTATDARKLIEQHPSDWRSVVDSYSGRIMADSSRLEMSQLNEHDISKLKPGFLSSIQENETDRSASFYYIVNVYSQTTPRQFEDARGMVMNDYQQELEEKWIAELKQKYPVIVNQQEWNRLLESGVKSQEH